MPLSADWGEQAQLGWGSVGTREETVICPPIILPFDYQGMQIGVSFFDIVIAESLTE